MTRDIISKMSLEEILHGYFPFGFPLSRKCWEWLDISKILDVEATGTFGGSPYILRSMAELINKKITESDHIEPLQTGHLASLRVIVDSLRYVELLYCHDELPGVIDKGLQWSRSTIDDERVERSPDAFAELFPPLAVNEKKITASQFLHGHTDWGSNHDSVIEETILLYLSVLNPAFQPFLFLFDDEDLKERADYQKLVVSLENYFDRQPVFSKTGQTLFESLRAPAKASPDSLEGQLQYILDNWSGFLPQDIIEKLVFAADIIKEEKQKSGLGSAPNIVPQFGKFPTGSDADERETESFSHDADWMSNVVIIAKSTHVWLGQLSKKYQRSIRYLSDIPDEELDRLAGWGFTSLWLIGIWQRSPASQTIKQKMGNPEAASSAYSLHDYVISDDLGGDAAWKNLRDRAAQRGIRLASDMVPNHVGLFSKWVLEHPDWFIQVSNPPWPGYSFNGPDLSSDDRTAVMIEDGYWDHRDAAVVFKRVDKWTGETRYIYHGNDGTGLPWNDTAQLDFTIAEVREAVIKTILHVAGMFPIIRFDAAMTLAKKHFQRLWFPRPGDGGAIPSRTEHGMSRVDFDSVFPVEFWREVVDRVAAEEPDTLLLAEAFWLMEGYFVRTLGMHRVYNSAFMNMLKSEDNAKYRQTIKNVVEFSPEILKRFVNFMNNPDELSAAEQFGKGDKYLGVTVMMVTMPGLPMFGHGQIEGFTEKYGMEYRRAYWDEAIDEDLVQQHESKIFPLMRRRNLFSGVDNFYLYDFRTADGNTDQNVFAWSNRAGDERAIIIYNNAYNRTVGSIHISSPRNIGTAENKLLDSKSLSDGLALNVGENIYYRFRDYQSGLEYLRRAQQIQDDGLFATLDGYQYHAFLDFKEIQDEFGAWAKLAQYLDNRGVASLDEAMIKMQLEPVHRAFWKTIKSGTVESPAKADKKGTLDLIENLDSFLTIAARHLNLERGEAGFAESIRKDLKFFTLDKWINDNIGDTKLVSRLADLLVVDKLESVRHVIFVTMVVRCLAVLKHPDDRRNDVDFVGAIYDDLLLGKLISQVFAEKAGDDHEAQSDMLLIPILIRHQEIITNILELSSGGERPGLFENRLTRQYLKVNDYQGHEWLDKERLEKFISALMLTAIMNIDYAYSPGIKEAGKIIEAAQKILDSAEKGGYRVDKMLKLLSD